MYGRSASVLARGCNQRWRRRSIGSVAVYKPLKGLKSTTFIADDDAGEYGAFSLWESKEDADADDEVLKARVEDAVGHILKAPLTYRLFEVLYVEEAWKRKGLRARLRFGFEVFGLHPAPVPPIQDVIESCALALSARDDGVPPEAHSSREIEYEDRCRGSSVGRAVD